MSLFILSGRLARAKAPFKADYVRGASEFREIIVNGKHLSNIRKREVPYLRRTMGIVFQDFRLIDNMTVFDNVAFAMHVVGASSREIRKRVPYILNLVGLRSKANSHPMELSGGEQQRRPGKGVGQQPVDDYCRRADREY